MPVVTLTTDLGTRDYYVSALKGAILNEIPDAKIVDVTHEIPPFDIQQAAFVLKNASRYFPKGTINIIAVNSEATPQNPHVLIRWDDQYFIGADNGIFSLMFDRLPEKIIQLDIKPQEGLATFPSLDIFVKAAGMLAAGSNPESLGSERKEIYERSLFRPVSDSGMIRGNVIYIDVFGNVITNITKELFEEVRKGRKFTIFLRKMDYNIDEISKSYNDVPEIEKLALFSVSGYLEIAINKGNASNLLGLKLNDTIRIEFHDH